MRVTGSIMSNNAMLHMAKSKVSYNKYFQQYMTNTKILKASDDPIIAIRSLKYRARISELEQYTDKNIPDAKSWIELTNTALDNVNTILTNMNEYCDQAANGPLETEDREKIKNQLLEYVKNIFEDNANQKNADRYLFTGYRTDIPLLFDSESTNTTYNITENFTPDDVFSYTYAYGGAEYDNPNTTAPEYAQNLPESKKTHIMTLSYDNTDINYDAGGDIVSPTVTFIDKNGTEQTVNVKTIPIAQAVPYNQCYDPNSDTEGYGAYYIPETGELAFRDDIYANISEASSITVNYSKTNFKENEIRPEHYFDCTATNNLTGTVSNYREPEKQQINYQINFSQTLTVNTLACDAFDISIKRAIDKVVYIMDEIEVAEAALAKVEKDIADGVGDQLGLAQLKEQIETKISIQETMLTDSFTSAMMTCQSSQSTVGEAFTSSGTREKRLESTSLMLDEQLTNYEEAKSENEDVDLGEAYIRFNESQLLYNATLQATSKILGNSLLDFI